MESGILSLMALARNDYEAEWNLGMASNDINRHSEMRLLAFRDQWLEVLCVRGGWYQACVGQVTPPRPIQHRRRGPIDYPPLSGNSCKECWSGRNLHQSFLVMHILGKDGEGTLEFQAAVTRNGEPTGRNL